MTAHGRHLLERLASLEERIRAAVGARRMTDPNPDDPFRGLYLSDATVDALLDDRRGPYEEPADGDAEAGSRLARLATGARLSPLDVELLLVAVAPDVDSRFEQFYGYLNDDVTRRRATTGLALRLCGRPEADAEGRSRLAAGAPLIRTGLLTVDEPERPFLSRTLRVPDRTIAHLLGDDLPDPDLAGVLFADDMRALPSTKDSARLARALANGIRLVYVHERTGASGLACAAAAFEEGGLGIIGVDAERLATLQDAPALIRAIVREAVMRGCGVACGPVDGLTPTVVLEAFADVPVPLVLWGTGGWDPRWSQRPPLQCDAFALSAAQRATLWREALDGRVAPHVDAAAATAHFVLGALAVRRAADAADVAARCDDTTVDIGHLRYGARGQNAAGLERLARRIEPTVEWKDLVLPENVLAGLRELAARARHRDTVLGEWKMRPGGGRGRGVTGLFAGDSGTGKTMSAEVIATGLGLDLYTVNLATVVDKYIGETEKNLERIFTEAAGVNGVLLFDEADAIFGKRSEVRDAHDRYANVESAYLLQRMETFDGLAVLATNLRANLDEAFTRRLDVVVDFPVPDEPLRHALWQRCLGDKLPRSSEVDLDFLANSFELAGGHIRSAAITAAYLAAEAGRPVVMQDVIGAVAREYRKLGRMCLPREFGPYLEFAAV
ncbi:ATP-binding protein [Phytomonospora sp. NPDC050363]|uniref:ATP-binding protein n=1 Tax=Phytomonospora sp. NPDC050363 TaxID=3155642 RepID=UPI0033C13480